MRGIIKAAAVLISAACTAQGAVIVMPANPATEDAQAAADFGRIWLRGTGEKAEIRSEGAIAASGESGPWFFVGETKAGEAAANLPTGLDDDGFRVRSMPGDRVILRGATPTGTELAVDWFAQHALGVRWFWPGEIGEEIPSFKDWRPTKFDWTVTPAFISRELGVDADWGRHNGLHGRLPHSHALFSVFPKSLFAKHPDWFPLLEGRRYEPTSSSDYNWQPNLALPEVAAHAAEVADDFFDRKPAAWGFSLSENDSIRFDESDATQRQRGPLRWFRGRPDYSDLVFGFMNRVADQVAQRHPEKLLSAYAYYWCENAPTFPVRPNIVPWLTADRSQYYDAKFAKEDRALIKRWCGSGAKIVGVYDYLYGAPFLVPRTTTRLTAESIQFEFQAGVRAYTAEANPNWAFDGPKLWMAAQLLWDPMQSVDTLLDDYYRRFWKEAAEPMRHFDGACEVAWRSQPGEAWWLKYYNDEEQAHLFPPALRRELRADIEDARKAAKRPEVRERIEVVSAAFTAVERFTELCEARDALSNPVGKKTINEKGEFVLLKDYLDRRAALPAAFQWAVAMHGVARFDLEDYFRNDPAPRAAVRLLTAAESGGREVRKRLKELAEDEGSPGLDALLRMGEGVGGGQRLIDPSWSTLTVPEALDDRTLRWSSGPWQARGEPVEGRSIRIFSDGGGNRVLRFQHDKAESLFQWLPASPEKVYQATVRFRGRVSPGNESFIVLNWMDRTMGYVGQAPTDRLAPGDWVEGTTLIVVGQAPKNAAYVGVGVHTYNQTGGDFAEFSKLILQRN